MGTWIARQAASYVTDNASRHLMLRGLAEMGTASSNRTPAARDLCSKIGTYRRALVVHYTDVPFYVALPSPTIDWNLTDGMDIPVENRPDEEIGQLQCNTPESSSGSVQTTAKGTPVAKSAFGVTPARLITVRDTCPATLKGLAALFPENAR